MKKQNECLNFFKGLACIFVVSLHVRFPVDAIDGPVQCIARFAVPLFFMISGYYCFYDTETMYLQKIPGKIKHITKICIASFAFWIMMQYVVCILGAGEHSVAVLTNSIFNLKSFIRLILFNDDPIISILWFLLALLYCYLICYFAVKTKHLKLLPKLIIPALILHFILGNVGTGLLNWSIDVEYYRNAWLMGFPLFVMGQSIKKNQNVILKKVSSNCAITLVLAGIVVSLIEWSVVGGRQQMYLGSIAMAAGCIIYSIWNSDRKIIAPISYIGAKLSMYVYVLHISVGIIIDKIAKIINVNELLCYQYIKPSIVILSTILISWIINGLLSMMER